METQKTRRPALLRYTPAFMRQSLFARLFRSRSSKWTGLYQAAELQFAPSHLMYNLKPGDVISDYIAFTGIYEAKLSGMIAKLAKTGGLLVDVGANMGYYSILWTAANPQNHSIAIEASTQNVAKLIENRDRNDFKHRIKVHRVAAGDSSGTVLFDSVSEDQTGWGGISPSANSTTELIEMKTIDELIGNQDVAVLKIDIEGADTWAILGAESLICQKRVKTIFFEQNRPRMQALGISESAAIQFLEAHGYKLRALTKTGHSIVEWKAYL
jgi:FkbM family methyltransferase